MTTAIELKSESKFQVTFFETYKSKESCPCCQKKCLHTNDVEKFDNIMHYSCLNCGYTFYEDEKTKKWRKKIKKDINQSTWSTGFLLLLTMFAVILALQVDRHRVSIAESQPINSQSTNVQPVSSPPNEIRRTN